MSREQIIRFWGRANLVRWPKEVLAKTRLPTDAKDFLSDAGFPVNADWTIRFAVNANEVPQLEANPRYMVVGRDDCATICLDEEGGGCVICVEEDKTVRFVNRNVDLFAEFLVLYQRYRLAARKLSEDAIMRVIDDAEATMTLLDAAALAGPDCWWSTIIEQVRAGLL